VGRIDALQNLDLHHQASRDKIHLITILKAWAAGFWAVVYQRLSQL